MRDVVVRKDVLANLISEKFGTQAAFARALGIHGSTVSHVVKRGCARRDRAEAFAKLLGCDPSEFIEDGNPDPLTDVLGEAWSRLSRPDRAEVIAVALRLLARRDTETVQSDRPNTTPTSESNLP